MSGDGARMEARAVTRVYGAGGAGRAAALAEVSLVVARGALCAVVGPSGCGKTSLLRLLAALDRPTTGEVLHDGEPLSRASESELALLRRRLGLVFQDPALLPGLRVWENVAYPLIPRGVRRPDRRAAALRVLERAGVHALADQRPEKLSGGERRRVGVARALVADPDAIVADEPTAHLDDDTAALVIALLRGLCDDGVTVVAATHRAQLADAADDVLRLGGAE